MFRHTKCNHAPKSKIYIASLHKISSESSVCTAYGCILKLRKNPLEINGVSCGPSINVITGWEYVAAAADAVVAAVAFIGMQFLVHLCLDIRRQRCASCV